MEADADYFILRIDDESIDGNTIQTIIEEHENANTPAALAFMRRKLKL